MCGVIRGSCVSPPSLPTVHGYGLPFSYRWECRTPLFRVGGGPTLLNRSRWTSRGGGRVGGLRTSERNVGPYVSPPTLPCLPRRCGGNRGAKGLLYLPFKYSSLHHRKTTQLDCGASSAGRDPSRRGDVSGSRRK